MSTSVPWTMNKLSVLWRTMASQDAWWWGHGSLTTTQTGELLWECHSESEYKEIRLTGVSCSPVSEFVSEVWQKDLKYGKTAAHHTFTGESSSWRKNKRFPRFTHSLILLTFLLTQHKYQTLGKVCLCCVKMTNKVGSRLTAGELAEHIAVQPAKTEPCQVFVPPAKFTESSQLC